MELKHSEALMKHCETLMKHCETLVKHCETLQHLNDRCTLNPPN